MNCRKPSSTTSIEGINSERGSSAFVADALRKIQAPTLILWGEGDVHFPPDWARRLAADIPGAARVEILPATGHLLMEEQPDSVADLIREFLTTTTRSGPKGAP